MLCNTDIVRFDTENHNEKQCKMQNNINECFAKYMFPITVNNKYYTYPPLDRSCSGEHQDTLRDPRHSRPGNVIFRRTSLTRSNRLPGSCRDIGTLLQDSFRLLV